MKEIWPSLISANLMNLQESINQLSNQCHGWHLDVMDNHFVPNLTWGAQFMNAIAQNTDKPLWIHLMIDKPESFLETLFVPKGTYITFHIETKSDIPALIDAIKAQGWLPSIAINPNTPIEKVFPYIATVDQILLMSVNPGFSGQQLMPEALKKIVPLKDELEKQQVDIPIAIDGGINQDNIVAVAQLGVSQFGIASGIFSWPNPAHELNHLHELLARI